MVRFKIFIFLLVLTANGGLVAQETDSLSVNEDTTSLQMVEHKRPDGTVVQAIVIDGDTTYSYTFAPVRIVALRPYGDMEKDKQFRRLRYHVLKVYPYAKLASEKLIAYNKELMKVKSKRKKRQLLKQREKELKEEFADVIKKMSVTQGRVLVKLIDRETGESTFDIIKEMRGGFKAFIYQGVARLYSADLKARYNPAENEEDEMIERIVLMIEEGKI